MKNPGSPISKAEFDKMRAAYDAKHPKKTKSVLFNKESIQPLLDNPKTKSIKIFFGLNEDGAETLMLQALDDKGEETTPPVNRGQLCPPYCS